jgi:hypothetical protein
MIILFWLATTSYVVVREWLPRLGTGAIEYNQLLANRAVDEHSNWIISIDGKRIGTVLTNIQPRSDGAYSLTSRASIGTELLGNAMGATTINLFTEANVSPFGRLRSFHAGLNVEGTNFRAEFKGEMKGDELVATVTSADLPLSKEPIRIPMDAKTPIGDSLAPVDRLPGLWVGRKWVTRMVDPQSLLVPTGLFSTSQPTKEVVHHVIGTETLVWNARPWECFVVEDRQGDMVGKTWVRRADDLVLKQEAAFGTQKVTMELEPPQTKTPLK